MSSPRYQYQPVERCEIRLLQLLPPNLAVQNDPIRCNIINISFERCHIPDSFFSYEALSYVWGGERTIPIYCGDREILVTPNLRSALSTLRQTMPKHPGFHRTLWVDAVCINQEDLEERGRQVRLMREVFARARRVLVFLGGAETERTFRHIKNGMDFDRIYEPGYVAKWREDASRIFDQPWFQRIWVIQEVAFSKRAIVLGGGVCMTWKELVNVAKICSRDADAPPARRTRAHAVLGIDHLRKEIRKRTNPDSESKPGAIPKSNCSLERCNDLLDLAQLFRSYAATDPRDKIYALLNLAMTFETDRVASRIEVDYTISASDLFLETARRITSGPEPLGLLRSVDASPPRLPGLPSWVPDWSCSSDLRPLSELCIPSYFLSAQRAVILKHPSPRVLKLVGRQVDIIHAVGKVMQDTSRDKKRDTLKSWNSIAAEHSARPFEAFSWNGFSFRQRDPGLTLQRSNAHIDFFLGRKFEVCTGRRYFVTKKSKMRHVGIAPAQSEVGDAVVMFPGAQLPVVVRYSRDEDMFSLVGECYVDSVNLDELIGTKKSKMREFCLK